MSPIVFIAYLVWRDFYKDLKIVTYVLDDIQSNPENYTKMQAGIFKMEFNNKIQDKIPSFENTLFIQDDSILVWITDRAWRHFVASSRLKGVRTRAIYLFNQVAPYGNTSNYTYESIHEKLSWPKEA